MPQIGQRPKERHGWPLAQKEKHLRPVCRRQVFLPGQAADGGAGAAFT
jgi:hypothetical protein